MHNDYKINSFIILIFLVLTIAVQIINFPIGVYDLDEDNWNRANTITAFIDNKKFAKDTIYSTPENYRYDTDLYFNMVIFKYFNSYEQYIAFLSFMLYFFGMVFLYQLLKIITGNITVAFFGSIFFSSSSIWFPPLGDIFALVPLYGAVGKSIAYVYYLIILIFYFRFLNYKFIDVITISLCSVLVFIHSITFLGPGLAMVCFILLKLLMEKKFIRFSILMGVFFAIILPYLFIFLKSNLPPEYISTVDKNMIIEKLKDLRRGVWNPLSVLTDLRYLFENTNFLNFAAFIPFFSLFGHPKKNMIRFFYFSCAILLFDTLIVRLIGYHFRTFSFYMLNRNIKWIYFYFFLIFISFFKSVEKNKDKLGITKPAKLNFIFALIIVMIFLMPLKETLRSNFGNKLLFKIIGSLPESFRINDTKYGLDLREINNDARKISSYINKNLPVDIGLAGPQWLTYRTHRSIIANFGSLRSESILWRMDIDKYKKIIEIDRIADLLNDSNNVDLVFNKFKSHGIDYILLEKFATESGYWYTRYIPESKYSYFSNREYGRYIEYENKNFLLLKTRNQ